MIGVVHSTSERKVYADPGYLDTLTQLLGTLPPPQGGRMELEEGYNGSSALGAQGGSAMAIIGAEDEDFENDIEPFQHPDTQSSLFQNLEILMKHPAYLMAFIQHVVLQFDSSPVLCYLHVDLILNRLGPKEAKKQFVDFCHAFLDKTGLLRVPVPNAVQYELDRNRPDLIPEDQQKKYLQDIQSFQEMEISQQLEDFREKKKMGMTPGEKELSELERYQTKDKGIREAKEKQLAEQLLAKLEEMHLTISPDEEKSSAIFTAIVTYMKHLGVKTKAADNKKSKANFFRKKISGAKKPEEALKPKKGFSILDPTRWNRGDSHYSDYRQSKPEGEAGEKTPALDKKAKLAEGSSGRGKGTPSGQDPSGVSVTVHPPPGEGNDGEQGVDSPGLADSGDSPVTEQSLAGEQLPPDEGAENERKRKRLTGKLGRSESLRVYERKRTQRGSAKGKQPRSRSDVDIEAAARANELEEKPTLEQARQNQGSRNLEPGGAGGGEPPPSFLLPQSEEFEPRVSELELDPPNWRELVPSDTLLRLKKSEVKRQEVINELFITEHAHLRMLRVLLEVFYQPLLTEGYFTDSELVNIFPGLEDLIDEHKVFLENLKKLREENNLIVSEIGSTLLARFDGPEGNWFQKISSRFCSRQSFALEQLKAKQKKEARFNQFIQEAESKPRCRRLQLKDIIPIEMQRLTKYPLLLHSIAKCTEEVEERQKVEKAAECCRQILNHVNQAVRVMENLLKLKDYQRRLDLSNLKQTTDPLLSEFRNMDITKRNLVYEGPLTWRVTKDKSVDVHVLLLDDILVLLQKQEERLVVKCHSRNITPTPDGKQMLSPIIKLNSAMTREVATDIKAFYVIFSWENGAQIYELVAQTVSERKNWCNIISDTAGSLKLPASSNSKQRLSVPNRTSPHSPSYYSEALLGGAENGSTLKEALQSEEQEKDGILEGTEFEERNPVGGPKLDKTVEAFVADLQTFCRTQPPGQVPLASAAQDRVSALKRLLQIPEEGEAIFPAEPTDLSPENGAPQEGEEEWDGNFRIEADSSRRLPGGSSNGPQDPEWGSEHLDKEGPRFSIILSLQQSDGVKHHLRLLEDAIQGLKDIETDYWRLQQLMNKFTSSQQPSST
ncbi:rho guanine nucleotide exchange factor 1 isoform X1 [Python bivittatus]|uniref:Rho guanine nucleotide exchange factor 1 isoform X1 n=2 Tax=Python bivittatus TaxID=176946 RepID=A0A9F5MYF9_PYTBI|nr:rho guanine nucleotide exchange factor 1 isoform X1 [Python bivittatus]XP_025023842.1 rho guanine nucleotide exchange factor 1 isoform X1 [Python bivittatus]